MLPLASPGLERERDEPERDHHGNGGQVGALVARDDETLTLRGGAHRRDGRRVRTPETRKNKRALLGESNAWEEARGRKGDEPALIKESASLSFITDQAEVKCLVITSHYEVRAKFATGTTL